MWNMKNYQNFFYKKGDEYDKNEINKRKNS